MRYSGLKLNDIANGAGVRTSLFVSGCRHRCEGCFNSVAWPFDSGRPFDSTTVEEIVESLKPCYVDGLSILGGEPLEPENQPDVSMLIDEVRREYPEKTVWMWTGFVWEDLVDGRCRACTETLSHILESVDVLVDGPYMMERRELGLRFRGSSNQRIIDLSRTRGADVCLWDDGRTRGTW